LKAGELEFDPEAQLKARTEFIDKQAEEARLRLGRSFALTADPMGGTAQNRFESFERGVLQQKAAAQSEVLQLQGQEQRANIATLLSITDSREKVVLDNRIVDLQENAQQFGQELSISELTGIVQGTGPENFRAFTEAFNGVEGDPNSDGIYNAEFDFDANGVVDFYDFLEFSRLGMGQPQLTLAGKAMAEKEATRKFNEKLATSAVTGLWEGSLTWEAAEKKWQNRQDAAALFGAAPPLVFHAEEFNALFSGVTDPETGDITYNVVEGSPSFDYNLDADGDGVLTKKDRDLIAPRIEEDPDTGLIFYQPPGAMTIAAQQLGLDEKALTQAALNFKSQLELTTNTFLTSMTGFIYETDPKTGVATIMKAPAKDGEDPLPLTTLEKQQFDIVQEQYKKAMQFNAEAFYNSLNPPKDLAGEDAPRRWDKLSDEERFAVVGTLAQMQYGMTAQGPSYGNGGPSGGDYVIAGVQAVGSALGDWWKRPVREPAPSDVNIKYDIRNVSSSEVLEAANRIPVSSWRYNEEPDFLHLGPMAQDVYKQFGLGDSDKHIHVVDMFGIALASIQELTAQNNALAVRIEDLEGRSG
jgi:hypothetical protein